MVVNTLDERIVISPDIAGGKPRIAKHRITVQNIVIWHEWMGISADEIATTHDLTLTDIYAALAFYYSNQDEIDASINRSYDFIESLKKTIPSKIDRSSDVTQD